MNSSGNKMKIYEYARFKRCMDMYVSDPGFRNMMDSSPMLAVAMQGYGDCLDPEAVLEAIRGIHFRSVEWEKIRENKYFKVFYGKDKDIKENIVRAHSKEAFPDERYYYYLKAQRDRCREESSAIRSNDMVYYYPYGIELASGCSVQCPFCGFAPEKLKGYFHYTPENGDLLRNILTWLREKFGEVTGYAPLYFATEPFDNLDYEHFVDIYHEVMGTVPQTTTAVAEKNADRIRGMIGKYGMDVLRKYAAFRFSIRNLEQFRKILSEFSPEETMGIELLPNNPESVTAYSESGKAKVMKERDDEAAGSGGDADGSAENGAAADGPVRDSRGKAYVGYSIDCVAGLKINMVEGSLEFIEPVIPSEEWPKGYRVLGQAGFTDSESFKAAAGELIDRFMK